MRFRFRDLTIPNSTDEDLSFEEIALRYKNATGRTLELSTALDAKIMSSLEHCDFLKIVRYPDPIGFAVVANKDIEEGKLLCSYGGDLLSKEQFEAVKTEAEKSEKQKYYLITHECLGDGAIDAENRGGIGTLFSHLPEQDEIDKEYSDYIQTRNVALSFLEDYQMLFFLTRFFIPKGTIMGFSYGADYWNALNTKPFYFARNSASILDRNLLPMMTSCPKTNSIGFFSHSSGCCPPPGSITRDERTLVPGTTEYDAALKK